MRYTICSMEPKRKKHVIVLWCTAGGLAVLLLLLLWVRTLSARLAEFVSRYIARPWVYFIGHLHSALPFSLFEFFVVAAVLGGVALIVLAIVGLCRKRGGTVLKGLAVVTVCALLFGNFYTLTAGFAYYRPAAPVPQSQTAFSSTDVTAMIRFFADDYNALANKWERDRNGNAISPYSFNELSEKLQQEYKRLDNNYYYGYTPRAKGVLNSWFLTLNNITGVTFVPFGEPTVNRDTPASDIPQVMAHEMAHAKGVAREGDANFVAYYVLLSSQDDYLRYCGYFATFGAALSAVNADSSIKDDRLEIAENIDPKITAEQQNAARFWSEKSKQPGLAGALNRLFEKVGDFVNDLFLKSNGAQNGSDSYSDKVGDGAIDNPVIDPDTGEIIYDVTYSSVQKMYFAVYENLFA
jgi:hypothetical protein